MALESLRVVLLFLNYLGPCFKFKKEYLDAESKDKVFWPGGESTHGHL